LDLGVVITDDDPHYRSGLAALFRHEPGFALVGSFDSAPPLLRAAEKETKARGAQRWDLALMDLEMPVMGGIEATRRIKEILPNVVVVALTVFEEPATILEMICAGADGYLLKKTPPVELVTQLRAITSGGSPLTPGVAHSVLDLLRRTRDDGPHGPASHPSRLDLSAREQEVLRGLARGQSYKQVAGAMHVSLDTVRSHIKRIYQKLQVHSVAEAVGRAIREGMV